MYSPAFAFSSFARKYIDPYPLHTAVGERNVSKVKAYLKYLKKQGERVLFRELHLLNQSERRWGKSPIAYIFHEGHQHDFNIMIVLLDAGFKPSSKNFQEESFFSYLYHKRGVWMFCFLLWYDADYEKLDDAPRYPSIQGLIKETAKDSKRRKQLLNEIDVCKVSSNHLEVARRYREIANLFLKHVGYVRGKCDDLELHYKKLYFDYQKEAYASYQLAEETHHRISNPSPGLVNGYKDVLKSLIDLGSALGKTEEVKIYQASLGLLELSSRSQRTHSISVASSESTVPFLEVAQNTLSQAHLAPGP
ncbi:MAG: hypothetical protein K0Q57_1156 [Gammaproteobacteria bacterium]|jgi:hypothetical protein|nr:hypothetical protein [Gammaproteobacteria bacterium]